jgi:hypothetical protein
MAAYNFIYSAISQNQIRMDALFELLQTLF